jgi:hypothetical protein
MLAGSLEIEMFANVARLQKDMAEARALVGSTMGNISHVSNLAMESLGGIAAAFAAKELASKLISVQREFDVLNSSLITVTGSSYKADQAFGWIQKFAATTPYQLNDVTGAFVKMKALGLDSSEKALASYGNTASAMGKNLNQMIEAVADASTGEFERLKEFGIKAKQQGDEVSLTFQGVTTNIGNNASEITKYLRDIGDVNFAGAMETRASTLDGALSNLKDNLDSIARTVNNSTGFSAAIANDVRSVNTSLQGFNETLISSKAAGDGVLKQWANAAGFAVGTAAVGTANATFNGFNWTVNSLTGNLLHLNENVRLLPESLMTNEQRAQSLSEKLKAAEENFARLNVGTNLVPGNFLDVETQRAKELVIELRKAAQVKASLNGSPEGAGRGSVNPMTIGQMSDQEIKNDADRLKLLTKLSGVSNDYIDTMKEIGRLHGLGVLTGQAYNDAIDKAHESIKAKENDYSKLAEEMRKEMATSQAELAANGALASSEKYRVDTLQKLIEEYQSGKISIKEYIDLESKMHDVEVVKRKIDAIKDEEKATKERVANTVRSINSELDAYYKERDAISAVGKALNDLAHANADQADALKFESTLMGQSAHARAVAIEQYKIMAQYKREAANISLTVADPVVRESMLAALAVQQQAAIDNAATARYQADWNKAYDEVSNNLSDSIIKAGKDGGDSLINYLEQLFIERPLKIWLQAQLQPVSAGIANMIKGQAGSGSGLGSVASLFGSSGSSGSLTDLFGSSSMGKLDIGGVGLDTIGNGLGYLSAVKSLSDGNIGSALGTAVGTYFGGPIGAALGSAIGESLFGGGKPAAKDTGRSHIDYSATGIAGAAYNTTGNSDQIAATTSRTNSIASQYYTTAAALGIKSVAAGFEYGTNDGQSNGMTVIGANVGSKSYSSGEIASTDTSGIQLAASRAVLIALQGSELPKYLTGVFDNITATTATQEQINTVLDSATAMKGFHEQLQAMPWESLKDLSYKAAAGLAAASGGLDKLSSNLGTYYDKFYSDNEKTALQTSNLTKSFASLGITMPAIDANTRSWYRSTVEYLMAQDQTVESNAKTTASVLALAGSVDQLAPSMDSVAKATADAVKTAQDAVKTAAETAYKNLQTAVDAQKKIYSVQVSAAQSAVTEITSVFDSLKSNVADLYGSVSATAALQAAQGNTFIDQALSTAQKTGYLPDKQQLVDAINAARGGVDSAVYASQKDADFARLVLSGKLDALKTISGDQLTGADKALKVAQDQLTALDQITATAQAQLDAFNGVASSVLSIGDALHAFDKATAGTATTQAATGSGTAGAGVTVVGPSDKNYTAEASKYAQKVNITGFGVVDQYITDPAEVKRLDSIKAYIQQVGVGSQESIKQIADAALTYGVSQQEIANATGFAVDDITKFFAAAGIPAFASGGYHAGGLALVGEQGPELVNFSQPAQIYNAGQTGSILGGNTQKLEALVASLMTEVQRLQSLVTEGNATANRSAAALEGDQRRPVLVEIAT